MLEAGCHERSLFVTYTYEKEPSNASVDKKSFSAHLHGLRQIVRRSSSPPRAFRFFAVGEYGDSTQRPHYHAALFGLGRADQGLIEAAWRLPCAHPLQSTPGFIHLADLTPDSAGYIAGYATKKLTKADDPRLNGRHPEFSLASRRPGIGSVALPQLVDALNTSAGALYIARHKDVPTAFMVGGRLLPLGPYMRAFLRTFFFGDHRQPKAAKVDRDEKLRLEVSASLPALQIPEAAFGRLGHLTHPEWKEVVQAALGNHIHNQEVKRSVRSAQIKGRHNIKRQRKTL